MTIKLTELVNFTNDYLQIDKVKDYCPNGLQVEGRQSIKRVIGGVTASQALLDEAVKMKADAVLVHHGYFWKGEPSEIVGIKKNRLKTLLENDISLLAYHLPLDVHESVGNNAQLAKQLDIFLVGKLEPKAAVSIGRVGQLNSPMSAVDFQQFVTERLGRQCVHIGDDRKMIESIGLCSGAAQGMIEQAATLKLDAYLSGEISEPTVHVANETGVSYFSAGHHATERGGVSALGEILANKFDLEFEFVDIHNPI